MGFFLVLALAKSLIESVKSVFNVMSLCMQQLFSFSSSIVDLFQILSSLSGRDERGMDGWVTLEQRGAAKRA